MLATFRSVVVLACCGVVAAQGDVFEEVALRIASLRPNGGVVVDRGKRDHVQVGDRVVLVPRNGQVAHGTVTELDERTALVQLVDPTAPVTAGTRGHVLVPKVRLQPKPDPAPQAQPTRPDPTQPADEWRPGMPLLGNTRPPRPEERPTSVHGRVYGGANLVRTLGDFEESWLVAGADVELDNLRGDGGTLRFHGDFTASTETSENWGDDLRLYELSYEHGGTRHQPFRWQVGRFLQRDMPEFGLLDGVEVGYRRENGHRFGASFGWLPELDDDLESLADLQIAGWYLWHQDVGERFTVGFGYQKTWHRWDVDRDLVVVKARLLPSDGWMLSGALWIDFYTARDDLKDETVEITRANAFASRRWPQVGGLELVLDHEEYPETRRRELPQTLLPQTLVDAHQDRASLHAYVHAGPTRWFTRLTGYSDEERDGGAAEFGVDVDGLLQQRARTTLAVFDVQGVTQSLAGVRVEHGGDLSFGRLDLLYELGFVHHEGMPSDRDDLLQHRLGALCTSDLGSGWDATFFADGTLWDDELSFGVGIWLQKHF
ncbi:MAG: hypothetical protein JNK15_23350 [Planctomycetes bacterium]|nr:hypothetical protein [Planctomycetota bacterium]